MNTSIIKGAFRTGLGIAIKRWASATDNRKLYLKGLAEEYMGRGQRQYGRALDTRDDIMDAASHQAARTNKALMKQVKKVRKSDTVKRLNKMLNKGAETLHIPAPVLATAAIVGVVLLLD